jgi:hypothetical protein
MRKHEFCCIADGKLSRQMPATTLSLRDELENLAKPRTGHYYDHLWSLAKRLHEKYNTLIESTTPEQVVSDVNVAFSKLAQKVQREHDGIVADIRHVASMESNTVPIPEVTSALMESASASGWASLFSAHNLKHMLPTPPATRLPLSYFELRVFSHAARRMGLGRPAGSPYVAAVDAGSRLGEIVNSCRLIFLGAAIKHFCVANKNYVFNNFLVANGLYEARRALEAEHTKLVKREVLVLQQRWDVHIQKVQTRFTAQQASLRLEQTMLARRSESGGESERLARLLEILEEADDQTGSDKVLEPTAELDALTQCLAEYTNSMRAALQSVPETPKSLVVPSFKELGTKPREESQSAWSDDALAYSGQRGLVLDFERGPIPRQAWEDQTLAYTDGVCEWLEQLIRQARARVDEVSSLQSSIADKRAMGRSVVADENLLGKTLSVQQETIDSVQEWDSSWNASKRDTYEARRRLGMVRNNQRRLATLSDIAHKLRFYSVRWLDWQLAECVLGIAMTYQQIEWAGQEGDRSVQVELYEQVHATENSLRHMLSGNHSQFKTNVDVDHYIATLQTSNNRSLSDLRADVTKSETAAAQAWLDINKLVTGDDAVTLCGQVQESLLETFANRIVHQSEKRKQPARELQSVASMDIEDTQEFQSSPTGAADVHSVMDEPMDNDVMESLKHATPLIPESMLAPVEAPVCSLSASDNDQPQAQPLETHTVVDTVAAAAGYERLTLSLPTTEAAERALRVRLHSLIRVKQGR